MKSAIRSVALASCLGAALAACASSTAYRTAGLAHASLAPGQHTAMAARCPIGRLRPGGGAVIIDYVPFVHFEGREYLSGIGQAVSIRRSQLGRVLLRVRCSFLRFDYRRTPPRIVDGTALLPVGTAVYEVRGYSPRCRLAAYMDGRLSVYLTQREQRGKSAPQSCALRRIQTS